MVTKHRGKRADNGEWIYGTFAKIPDMGYYIMPECYFITRDFGDIDENDNPILSTQFALGGFIKIDPDTLGVYIVTKDDDRQEIYTGDIVMVYNDAANDKDWGLELKHIGIIEFKPPLFSLMFNDGGKKVYLDHWLNAENIEKLGNIFDNPDIKTGSVK